MPAPVMPAQVSQAQVGSIAEIDFSDKYLGERWAEVKEDFWGDLKRETVVAVRRLLETSMEVEMQDLIGSPHWKHNPESAEWCLA